jgi:hypothetical protein
MRIASGLPAAGFDEPASDAAAALRARMSKKLLAMMDD